MNITTENNVTMIEVPVSRDKNGVDIKTTALNAERVVKEYAAQDQKFTDAVKTATTNIITNDRYKERKSFTTSEIAGMVAGVLNEVPSVKFLAETEVRVKAFMGGQPEKYLGLSRGRNAGWHFINRYNKEELMKLQAEKVAADKAAAEKLAKKATTVAE